MSFTRFQLIKQSFMKCRYLFRSLLFCLLVTGSVTDLRAYAILSHEAVIDDAWDDSILPLLKKRYPGSTEEELKEARAYIYGGSVMPDMGYFPLGSALFSNLVHYVRTGDFISALLDEAGNLNEFAFALGFLCHYDADCIGHPNCTNKAVPELFPKAKSEFGEIVTYEQCKSYHARTEFSFDIFKVANGNYAPKSYHDFIGFKISKPVLERAFVKTYGLEVDEIFTNFSVAEALFRFSVRSVFPALTKAAWRLKKADLEKEKSDLKKKDFVYKIDKKAYREEHGKPGIRSMGLAFFIAVLPKVGPLSPLRFKVPGKEVEIIFNESFKAILQAYKNHLEQLQQGHITLENLNWDTGKQTEPGVYKLADETYFELLTLLDLKDYSKTDGRLRENILSYYKQKEKLLCPPAKKTRKWNKIDESLDRLAAK